MYLRPLAYTHVVVHGFRVARVVGLVGAGGRVGRVRGVVVRRGRVVTVVLVTDSAVVTAVVSGCAVSQVTSAGHLQDESDECALQRKNDGVACYYYRYNSTYCTPYADAI